MFDCGSGKSGGWEAPLFAALDVARALSAPDVEAVNDVLRGQPSRVVSLKRLF